MTKEVILQQFFYHPMHQFGVRELSRLTGLDTKTVMKYLVKLVEEGILLKQVKLHKFPKYEANRLSKLYRFEKAQQLTRKIIQSGVAEFLQEQLTPKAIVLFGSIAKGTYHEQSDIDLFIHGPKKRIDLSSFDNLLGHDISLLFEEDLTQFSKGLLINIANGITLSGILEVV